MIYALSVYSFPFSSGFAKDASLRAPSKPIGAIELADRAHDWDLSGIEVPLPEMLPDLAPQTIENFRAHLKDRGIRLVVDTGVVDPERLAQVIPLAAQLDAHIIRGTVSTILEGARAKYPGGWQAHLNEISQRLTAIRPILEEHGMILALENHQDTSSDDLIELCRIGGPNVGITFDVANPLAVGEDIMAFARKIGPLIRNVHLKDYFIFPTTSGVRLVRCALGEGCVPFPELLALLAEVAPDAPLHIELAALYARHIRLLEEDWWEGYPPRDVRDFVPLLRWLGKHAQPTGAEWQTPWETGAPSGEVEHYEYDQFIRSVTYLRSLGGQD